MSWVCAFSLFLGCTVKSLEPLVIPRARFSALDMWMVQEQQPSQNPHLIPMKCETQPWCFNLCCHLHNHYSGCWWTVFSSPSYHITTLAAFAFPFYLLTLLISENFEYLPICVSSVQVGYYLPPYADGSFPLSPGQADLFKYYLGLMSYN